MAATCKDAEMVQDVCDSIVLYINFGIGRQSIFQMNTTVLYYLMLRWNLFRGSGVLVEMIQCNSVRHSSN